MKGLLCKDWFTLGNFKRTLAIQGGLVVVLTLMFGRGENSLGASYTAAMTAVVMSSVITSTFSYDESASWDRYATALPISRKTVVAAKYLFCLLCFLGCVLVVAALAVVSSLLWNPAMMGQTLAVNLGMVAGIVLLMLPVSLPVAFKLGAEKARMATFWVMGAVFVVVIAGVMLLQRLAPGLLDSIDFAAINYAVVGVVAAVVLLGLLVLSYVLSVRFYIKREF